MITFLALNILQDESKFVLHKKDIMSAIKNYRHIYSSIFFYFPPWQFIQRLNEVIAGDFTCTRFERRFDLYADLVDIELVVNQIFFVVNKNFQ